MVQLIPTDALEPAALHAAFSAAFADYLIGPFRLSLDQWPQFLARQGADPGLGRAAVDAEGRILAFALVAPRPGRWRLATMGALPAARGSGAAPRLLDDFIARGRAAGLAALELEVFAQNERALRLYQGRGFSTLHELHGWQAGPEAVQARACAALQRPALDEALAWIDALDLAHLPLQVTPVALRAAAGLQAWRHGGAQLIFSLGTDGALQIASLIDTQPAQRDALALLQALRHAHPERPLRVPQLQRDDLGGQALRAAGFERQPLHQLLMGKELAA